MVLSVALLPLVGAVPLSRIKEPNAVFAFDVANHGKRVKAVLFDRQRRLPLENLDISLETPASGNGYNDIVQFSAGSKKVYINTAKVTDETKGREYDVKEYKTVILGGGFSWKDPEEIFSCDACTVGSWIVHPTEPKLYLSLFDKDPNGDEFRNAKLVEITLAPVRKTKVIARIPATQDLRVSPDGKWVYVFGRAKNSRRAYGELVKVGLTEKKRSKTVVNLPESDYYQNTVLSSTSDVSPDTLEIAYHFGTIDMRTKDEETIKLKQHAELANSTIGWSRSGKKLLFQLQSERGRDDKQLTYNRDTKGEWVLPLRDAAFLQWSPSETAILYDRWGDIGFYDLKEREWVHVFDAGPNLTGGAAWVTLPTKRVPKR